MDSKRVKFLRNQIIKAIPRVPNNKKTLQALEQKHLTDLLIIYMNWASRLVAQRKRKIVIENSARKDNRWNLLRDKIDIFLKKVIEGDDLNPHLSTLVLKKGYFVPETNQLSDGWEDKDFILNVMRYHHFHLGEIQQGKQHTDRTDEILFAKVSPDTLTVLAIFSHEVFENMTEDRRKLWSIFDQEKGGDFNPGITLSGNSVEIGNAAIKYSRLITEIDPKLDNIDFVRSLDEFSGIDTLNSQKLTWFFNYLDLGVKDKVTGISHIFKYGPN